MGYNRFYLTTILNCCLIFSAAFLFFFFLNIRQQPSTAAGVGVLALLLLVRLIFHMNRTNRILANFLGFMQEKDPSLSYTVKYVDRNFRGLNERLGSLIREFKEHRIDLEIQAQYLESILKNVSTGILCFNDSGEVQTMNKATWDYLGTEHIRHLRDLDEKLPGFSTRLLNMGPGAEVTELIRSNGKTTHLSVKSSLIHLKGEAIHTISLNDISNQMEEQEIRSWKKLIRVINHEIMNSMTPIITLAAAIRKKLMKRGEIKPVEHQTIEALEDAVQSAEIIEERSGGLVNFIERYKKLTSLPPVKMVNIPVGDLLSNIEKLLREELSSKGIHLECQSDCTLEVKADRQLIEQVLINLIRNSEEAVQHSQDPEISVTCNRDQKQHIYLIIKDNGEGIPMDKLDQVFVPFFTTREDGSGIGLSLCKQIIQLHNGQINLESTPGEGTRVIIGFKE